MLRFEHMTPEEIQEKLSLALMFASSVAADISGGMVIVFSEDGKMHFRGQVPIETAIRCFRNMADRLEGTVTPAIDDGSVVATAPPVAPEHHPGDMDFRPGGPADA